MLKKIENAAHSSAKYYVGHLFCGLVFGKSITIFS